VDVVQLENALREELNARAPRRMAVLRPLKLVIENYPAEREEWLAAQDFPEQPERGTRQVPFARELWIEADDFRVEAPKKYWRLAPGREVRLRYAYYVTCTGFTRDARGDVTEVRCTYDPATRGGDSPDGRKVPGTIHWVSARHAFSPEVRLYDHLFQVPFPEDVPAGGSFRDHLNPASRVVVSGAQLEPSLRSARADEHFQFERQGYFRLDPRDSTPARPVFHRAVALRDSWAKIERKLGQGAPSA
jgi:glutaminyl-tRNA synthetase